MSMYILMHPARFEAFREGISTEMFDVPGGTRIIVDPHLPLEDKDGNPIAAFKVDGDVVWHWTGEPISLPKVK